MTSICDDVRFFPLLWSYSIVFILFKKRIQRTLTLSSLYTSSEEGDSVTRVLHCHQIKLMTEPAAKTFSLTWKKRHHQPYPRKGDSKAEATGNLVQEM